MIIFVVIYFYVICYVSLRYSGADNSTEREIIARSRQTMNRLKVCLSGGGYHEENVR